jgi:hypothetical protein
MTNGGVENATAFQWWTKVNSTGPSRTWANESRRQGDGFTSVATTSVVHGTKTSWQGMTDNVTGDN